MANQIFVISFQEDSLKPRAKVALFLSKMIYIVSSQTCKRDLVVALSNSAVRDAEKDLN